MTTIIQNRKAFSFLSCIYYEMYDMKKLSKDEFIEKANLVHQNKYVYSKLKYLTSRDTVQIICPVHGEFKQKASSHLSGKGCLKCGLKVFDTKKFIENAIKIHGNLYDYSLTNYISAINKVDIICPIHGIFQQRASSHLDGFGCPRCSYEKMGKNNISTTQEFIEKANQIHNNKYDYTLTNYINNKFKVKIICPIHGEFEQTPHAHKRGNGCRKCANDKISKSAVDTSRGWSLTDWLKKHNQNRKSTPRLYVVKCYNDFEEFIKIGITMREIKSRFKNKKLMPYKFDILIDFKSLPDDVFKEEIRLKNIFKNYKYIPKFKFSGDSECFNSTAIELILKIFNNENFDK